MLQLLVPVLRRANPLLLCSAPQNAIMAVILLVRADSPGVHEIGTTIRRRNSRCTRRRGHVSIMAPTRSMPRLSVKTRLCLAASAMIALQLRASLKNPQRCFRLCLLRESPDQQPRSRGPPFARIAVTQDISTAPAVPFGTRGSVLVA